MMGIASWMICLHDLPCYLMYAHIVDTFSGALLLCMTLLPAFLLTIGHGAKPATQGTAEHCLSEHKYE